MTALAVACSFISPAIAAETVVYSQGFEADDGGFTVVPVGPTTTAKWQWGTPPASPAEGPKVPGPGAAHSGSKCWGTNFGGMLPRPSDESIVSPPIKLPKVGANQIIRVRFWAFVSLDGMYDRGQFFISKDNSNWDSVAQLYNNMEQSAELTPQWHKYEFTIDPSYAASDDPNQNTVYLRLRAAVRYRDPSFGCGGEGATDLSGVYVDDVAITYYDVTATRKVLTLKAWEDPSTWASCPWVAPWNGASFEPENDVYSVARGAASEYRDAYRLRTLAARGGVYPLEIRERESEISYTDAVTLLQVDHAPGVAVAPDGAGVLHGFDTAALLPPASAVANGIVDFTAALGAADGEGFAAYDGDTLLVDFGDLGVARGATLVLGATGFVLGSGPERPYSGPPAIVVETAEGGAWVERGRFLPRYEYALAAFDLKPFLADGQPVQVRLRSVSHAQKYHLVDFVALDASGAPALTVVEASPSLATLGATDVRGALAVADGRRVKLGPGDKIALEFPVAPLAPGLARDLVLATTGYYEPQGGSYLIYTKDPSGWVQRDGHSHYAGPGSNADVSRDYDLSLFLPDPEGRYRVWVWQDYQYESARFDYAKLTLTSASKQAEAPLVSARDYSSRNQPRRPTSAPETAGTDVLALLLAPDDDQYDYWSGCPRDRMVELEFEGPPNVPPHLDPVVVGTNGFAGRTPAISWTYLDDEGDPQASAEVQVWSGPGATDRILWNPPEFAGAGTSVRYAGEALTAGVTYYARVRASDGKDWGPWTEVSFTPAAGADTALAYTGGVAARRGTALTLSAILTEVATSSPCVGDTVVLTIGTGSSAQSCTAVTDGDGRASCRIARLQQAKGSVLVTAVFHGDEEHLPSRVEAALAVSDPVLDMRAGGCSSGAGNATFLSLAALGLLALRRRRAIVAVLAALTVGQAASAQTAQGFALQTFEPAPAGDSFFAVPGATVDAPAAAGLVFSWAHDPLVLRQDAKLPPGSIIVHRQSWAFAQAAVPVGGFALLDLALPVAFYQTGGQPTPDLARVATHIGDLKLGARIPLPTGTPVNFAAGVDVWIPTGTREAFASDGSARFFPKLIAGGEVGSFVYGADVGFILRKPQDLVYTKTGNALAFGGAVGWKWRELLVGPEVYGRQQFDGIATSPVEALLGAHWRHGNASLGLAVGAGLDRAPGAAPFRALVQLALGLPGRAGPEMAMVAPAPEPVAEPLEPEPADTPPAPPVVEEPAPAPEPIAALPAAPPQVVLTPDKIEILQSIQFAHDRATILPVSEPILREVAGVMTSHPEIGKVLVEGHTDAVGGADYNARLSERRARAVQTWLVEKGGVDAARLDAQGFGLSRPVAPNDSKEGRAKNRRVEFKIVE